MSSMRCTGGNCPIKKLTAGVTVCTAQDCPYRTEPMTNADRIRAMSDEELAHFIEKLAYGRKTPWGNLFQETFCKSCPAHEYITEHGQKMRLRECDFADGECPHGSDIAWWLQQPAEEGD